MREVWPIGWHDDRHERNLVRQCFGRCHPGSQLCLITPRPGIVVRNCRIRRGQQVPDLLLQSEGAGAKLIQRGRQRAQFAIGIHVVIASRHRTAGQILTSWQHSERVRRFGRELQRFDAAVVEAQRRTVTEQDRQRMCGSIQKAFGDRISEAACLAGQPHGTSGRTRPIAEHAARRLAVDDDGNAHRAFGIRH